MEHLGQNWHDIGAYEDMWAMKEAREKLEQMLAKGMVQVLVHGELCTLPPEMQKPASVIRLNLSYKFGCRFPMKLTDEGVSARLSFEGALYDCFLPYHAIVRMYGFDDNEVWSAPQHDTPVEPSQRDGDLPEVIRRRGHLRLIRGGA